MRVHVYMCVRVCVCMFMYVLVHLCAMPVKARGHTWRSDFTLLTLCVLRQSLSGLELILCAGLGVQGPSYLCLHNV